MNLCTRSFFSLVLGASLLQAKTQVNQAPFGKLSDGTTVEVYVLKNEALEVRILTLGGAIQALQAPDRQGKLADVVLGFETVEGYTQKGNPFFGALIGRYGNRIAKGRFTLHGKAVQIPCNDGQNTLHGGPKGFDKVVWKAKAIQDGVELTHVSPDGDQGYPGTLKATVRYTLKGKDLQVDYSANTDQPTVVNLTNHAYFNLAGHASGDILKQQLTLHAAWITPVGPGLIPTGELLEVKGTPFDFLEPHAIGERIAADDTQLKVGGGYDHNWVVRMSGQASLSSVAKLVDPASGRCLEVLSTEPGIQFYSGNFLDGTLKGKGGVGYGHRSGLCLETQHFPDSPNHSGFPTTELKPGKPMHSCTVFRFSAQ